MRQLKLIKKLTSRNEILDAYFQDISRYTRITPEEEIKLALQIKRGNKEALNKMVTSNLRFVVSVAKQYQSQNTPLEDLIAWGNIGLIKAARRFDETRGFKFISYAGWWIRESILRGKIKNGRTVRLPADMYYLVNKVQLQSSYLEQKNGTSPTIEDIASNLKINVKAVKKTIPLAEKEISLDRSLPYTKEDDNRNLANLLPSKEFQTNDYGLLTESKKYDLERALNTLKKNEGEILKQFFGINNNAPKTNKEIAESFGYAETRVGKIKRKALQKLRENKRVRNILKEYL
mgnify:CR=1 FL=1